MRRICASSMGSRPFLLKKKTVPIVWYAGTSFGFMNVEETEYGHDYGNQVTYKFVKVAGINVDLTEDEYNLKVLEKKK